jgi:hypothetical protein
MKLISIPALATLRLGVFALNPYCIVTAKGALRQAAGMRDTAQGMAGYSGFTLFLFFLICVWPRF